MTASCFYLPAQSSLRQENVTVFGCLTHEVPLSLGDAAVTCAKGRVRNWGRRGTGRPGRGGAGYGGQMG